MATVYLPPTNNEPTTSEIQPITTNLNQKNEAANPVPQTRKEPKNRAHSPNSISTIDNIIRLKY